MDTESLVALRDEIFTRIRAILYDRYGEYVPASMIENQSQTEAAVKKIERLESFKADEDLLDLFEALHKIFVGSYGHCLFCRSEIDFSKLKSNPLLRFCDDCERILNPS